MKFLQYGTGCAEECSEVTESTIPYLLNFFFLEGMSFIKECLSDILFAERAMPRTLDVSRIIEKGSC